MKKAIVITGASTGIGRETAKYFAEKGWKVAATMRSPEKEAELQKNENINVYQLDVTDSDSIVSAKNSIIKDFGKVDVVLNNAGYALMGALETITQEQFRYQYDVNVFGLVEVTQAFIPHFRSNNFGMFINISSVGGKITFPYMSPYLSTKWAVEGFSESLYFELNRLGIQVKTVEPGFVATDFGGRSLVLVHSDTIKDYDEGLGKLKNTIENTHAKNPSHPSVVAEVIWEAATDGKDQFRYVAGNDAVQTIANRNEVGDEAFIQNMKIHVFEH